MTPIKPLICCLMLALIPNTVLTQATSLCHSTNTVAGSGLNVTCNSEPYTLVFHDEFDGTELNIDNWRQKLSGLDGEGEPFDRTIFHDCIRERQIYLENNLSVNDGFLVLTAKHEQYTWSGTAENGVQCGDNILYEAGEEFVEEFNFTSGAVSTIQSWNPENLFIEARIKIPKGKALWPAFWVWHHDEIDIFEYFNSEEDDHFRTDYHKDGEHCSVRHDFDDLSKITAWK